MSTCLPIRLLNLLVITHLRGYLIYLCITGEAVPIIQQFFGHLDTRLLILSA